jgi:putative ABC transport system ATP-binding protein
VRCNKIGYIFQSYNLITVMSARENVALPAVLRGASPAEATAAAEDVLRQVGLGHRLDHLPMQLSGGQQQRVAIARALVNKPSVILADEPTGNLDTRTGQEVIELLASLQRDRGCTIITATHDVKMLKISDRIAWIRDGKLDRLETRETIRFGTVTDKLDGRK